MASGERQTRKSWPPPWPWFPPTEESQENRKKTCTFCGTLGIDEFPHADSSKPGFAKRMEEEFHGDKGIKIRRMLSLGNGQTEEPNFDRGTSSWLSRDYPAIANLLECPMNELTKECFRLPPVFVPEKFLCSSSSVFDHETMTGFHSKYKDDKGYEHVEKQLKGKKSNANGDDHELIFFRLLEKRGKKGKLMSSIIINGINWYIFGGGSQEKDFVLVNLVLGVIMIVEVKSTLNKPQDKRTTKALKQLKEAKQRTFDYFRNDLRARWKCATLLFCGQQQIETCDNCDLFVLTEKKFDKKMDKIEKKLSRDVSKVNLDYIVDFVTLAKYFLFLLPSFDHPLPTRSRYPSSVQNALERIGSPENIMLIGCPTPGQRIILKRFEQDNYRIVLAGPWGSGKTMLMQHHAMTLAQKLKSHEKRVLFLVLSAIENQEPILVHQLRKYFCKFHDTVHVKSMFLKKRMYRNGVFKFANGYDHVFVDEVYGDFLSLDELTKTGFLKALQGAKTAAIALSSWFYKNNYDDFADNKSELTKFFKTYQFEMLSLNTVLRSPKDIFIELQEYYKVAKRNRHLHFVEEMTLKAVVPPKLPESGKTSSWNKESKLVEEVLQEVLAEMNVGEDEHVLIIIDDDSIGYADLEDVICSIPRKCRCSKILMYLTLDCALQTVGRNNVVFYCKNHKSPNDLKIDGKNIAEIVKDHDVVTTLELVKGWEHPFLIDLSNNSETISRCTARAIVANPDWAESMTVVKEKFLTDGHCCENMMDRQMRSSVLASEQVVDSAVLSEYEPVELRQKKLLDPKKSREVSVSFAEEHFGQAEITQGPAEPEPRETEVVEAEPSENGPVEIGPAETGPTETGPAETGSAETGSAEIKSVETGAAETDSGEFGPADTGRADSESEAAESDSEETGPAETRPARPFLQKMLACCCCCR